MYIPKTDSSEFLCGDELLFDGAVSSLPGKRNPYEFDYKKYLNRNNIDFQINGKNTHYLYVKKGTGFMHYIGAYRNQLAKKLDKYLGEEEAGVAKALIIGNKNDLSPESVDAFKNTGSMHVLAVSGLHLGILFLIVSGVFKIRLLQRVPRVIPFLVIVSVLWFYVFLSGMSISVKRAAIMFTVIQLGILLERKGNVINSLFLSAFVVLLLFPKELFQVGFQLSYLAVIGIVLLHRYIDNWFEFPNRILNYLWSIVAVSLSAQLSIGLLSMYYFHCFPLMFPVSNIVVIVLSGMELSLGFLFVLFNNVDLLAMPIVFCLELLISIKLKSLSFIGSLPNVLVNSIYFKGIELILYYLLLLSMLYFLLTKKAKGIYITLASFLLIGVYITYEEYDQYDQDKIVLFGNNQVCLAYLKGPVAYVYVSENLNEAALDYFANPYLRYNGIQEIVMLQDEQVVRGKEYCVYGNGLIRFRDKFYRVFKGREVVCNKSELLLVPKNRVRNFLRLDPRGCQDALLLSSDSNNKYHSSDNFVTLFDN